MEWVRDLIREALGTLSRPQGGQVINIDHRRTYLPRDKMICLCIKYLDKYGLVTPSDNEKTTYERLIMAINRDPELSNIQIDQNVVNEFLARLRDPNDQTLGGKFLNRVRVMLHSPNLKLADAYYVLHAVSYFLLNKRKEKGVEVENGVTLSLNVKLLDIDLNSSTGNKTQTYDFVDAKGRLYRKWGSPPPLYLRKSIGSKNRLAVEPYEMFYNDAFSFKAKVEKTYTNSHGHVVNIIKNIQPIV